MYVWDMIVALQWVEGGGLLRQMARCARASGRNESHGKEEREATDTHKIQETNFVKIC